MINSGELCCFNSSFDSSFFQAKKAKQSPDRASQMQSFAAFLGFVRYQNECLKVLDCLSDSFGLQDIVGRAVSTHF